MDGKDIELSKVRGYLLYFLKKLHKRLPQSKFVNLLYSVVFSYLLYHHSLPVLLLGIGPASGSISICLTFQLLSPR